MGKNPCRTYPRRSVHAGADAGGGGGGGGPWGALLGKLN